MKCVRPSPYTLSVYRDRYSESSMNILQTAILAESVLCVCAVAPIEQNMRQKKKKKTKLHHNEKRKTDQKLRHQHCSVIKKNERAVYI